MLDSKNNIKKVFIAKNIARSAGATAGVVAKPSVLADGEIVITDVAGRILNATTVLGQSVIQVRQGRGVKTPPIKIAEINYSGLTSYTGAAFSPAVEQVSYIGYNGTALDFEATSATEKRFITKVTPLPNSMTFGAVPFNVKDSLFVSAPSTTNINNAIGVLKNLIISFIPNRDIDFKPKFELVASDTFVAYGANTVTSMTFTKYSKQVTVVQGSTGSALLTAGSFIRLSGTVGATTAPVYKIATGTALSANSTETITLDWAYQGESATILVADLTNKPTLAASAGVKVSGVQFRYDVNRWRQYDKMRFSLALVNGYTTTAVTKAVGAEEGTGTWQQTQNDEYIGWGDEGQINPMQLPFLPREQDAEVNNNYSILNLGFLNRVEDTMVATGRLKGNVILYLNKTSGSFNGNSTTGSIRNAVAVLDAWAAQNSAFSAQIGNL